MTLTIGRLSVDLSTHLSGVSMFSAKITSENVSFAYEDWIVDCFTFDPGTDAKLENVCT